MKLARILGPVVQNPFTPLVRVDVVGKPISFGHASNGLIIPVGLEVGDVVRFHKDGVVFFEGPVTKLSSADAIEFADPPKPESEKPPE